MHKASSKITFDRQAIFVLITSLIRAELESGRKKLIDPAMFSAWNEVTALGENGLEMDSIDLLQVAAVVDEFFHLHETGVEEYLLRHRTLGSWCDIVLQALEKGHKRFTFRTSGSQGTPKAVIHRASTILEEVSQLRSIFRGRLRIVSLVAPHHIYGFLFSVMLPKELGASVVDAYRWPATKIVKSILPGDLIIGYPLIWHELQKRARGFPCNVYGVTSTAPCDPGIAHSLIDLGLSRMTEIYGSSETGGVGYRHDTGEPYRLFGYWHRVPASKKLMGQFALKRGSARQIVAPDLLQWHGVRRFYPVRRGDGAVQVAGINVFPDDIARRLRMHPAVADCVVRKMRPAVGERLKAFIILKTGYNKLVSEDAISQWIYEKFTTAERPTQLVFGDELPVTPLGKSTDW